MNTPVFQRFLRKPDVDMLAGIRVTKDTAFEYKNENVDQTLKDLVFHSVTKIKGENYESTYETMIHLAEGDVLIFEEEGRGYVKPVEEFVTVSEAIGELRCIEDL